MAKFKIYKLRFTSPLHIGDERDDYGTSLQTIHSDTLHAAMVSVLAKVGHPIPNSGDFGFAISSLFPYYEKGQKQGEDTGKSVYFFPKPKLQAIPNKDLQDHAKKIKKIEWLDLAFFNKLINGQEIFPQDFDTNLLENERYLSSEKFDKDFISKSVSPRVQVSRDFSEDAEPFYMERLYFKEKSGLYFITLADTEQHGIINKALKILQHEGIGTDRTIGNGFFEFETDEIELTMPESNKVCNLSLFLPKDQDQLDELLNGENIAYNFQKRGGWITDAGLNTYRKNTVKMFGVGSVFSQSKKMFDAFSMGDIVDLKPNIEFENISHPIWRSGKALFLPVKLYDYE